MASQGLGAGAAGADMLQEVLRQKLEEQVAQARMRNDTGKLRIEQQTADDNSAYRKLAQQSQEALRSQQEESALAAEGAKIGASLQKGTNVTGQPGVIKALTAAGLAPQHTDATIGSTNLSGIATTGDVGPGNAAPQITRIARAANPGQQAKDIVRGTAQQDAAEQARKDKLAAVEQARQDKVDAAEQSKSDKEDLLKVAAGLRPAPQGQQPQLFFDKDGKPHAVQFAGGHANEIPLPDGLTGKTAPKTDTLDGTTKNRLQSAKAVTQTGNDIIQMLHDPKVTASLGQAMSRYSSVSDFVGNAPPEWSQLAGAIESFSLANMGVHGMRSSTGAEAIKGTLGQGRHTPESMIAAIQGLNGFSNHLLENNKGWDKNNQSADGPSGVVAPAAKKQVRYDMNGAPIKD